MPIVFECLECSTSTEVDDDLAGRTIRCRECHSFGRVPVPPPPKKPREVAPSPAVNYRCPFCHSTNRPAWRRFWTPISTLVWLVAWPIVFGPIGGFCAALIYFWGGIIKASPVAAFALGAAALAVPCVVQYLFARSRFLREERQVCPDCGVRVS